MVVDMDGPYVLETADLSLAHESGGVVLRLMMTPAEPEVFAQNSGHPGTPGWDRHDSEPQSVVTPDNGPLRILLDPGHGGIDPGADQGGVLEKDLMLLFAIELRDL
jgi:N-acetylmuramoyl-L-alanine amidase